MGKAQKSELRRFDATLCSSLSGKTAKLNAARLLTSYLKTKAFQPVFQSLAELPCILLAFKTGQKIIGKTKIITLHPWPVALPDA